MSTKLILLMPKKCITCNKESIDNDEIGLSIQNEYFCNYECYNTNYNLDNEEESE